MKIKLFGVYEIASLLRAYYYLIFEVIIFSWVWCHMDFVQGLPLYACVEITTGNQVLLDHMRLGGLFQADC